MSNETIKIITELDPCTAPEGIADLEPWMAYVGRGGELPEAIPGGPGSYFYHGHYGHSWLDDGCGVGYTAHYAVDVRTEWAQQTFPEHCRIRAYVAPTDATTKPNQ